MSDNDAKDMDEYHQDSVGGSETGEPEQKLPFQDEMSNEAEDVEASIEQIEKSLNGYTIDATHQTSSAEKTGMKTIEQWLTRDNLVVYPVWIGNLPRDTSVPDLRRFLECEIGRVLISVHISPKRNTNERTYAFLNLPTAEKQILAVTLLDGSVFHGEKLIVRSKRPSKFPQSFFGSSPISDHFKHFRDCVVPAILAAPTVNLNVHAVKRIMEEHNVGLDNLPNRVWCVQCTLTPNCHRTYCSFYHNQEERELGRIISILAAQNCESSSTFDLSTNDGGEMLKRPVAVSRHTLLIEGLPKSVSTQKLTEMFEVFGEIDHVIVNPNNTCFLRMKRSQDARKIVHLLNMNNSGIQIQFAPYAANPTVMQAMRRAAQSKRGDVNKLGAESGHSRGGYHGRSSRNAGAAGGRLPLIERWSHDTIESDVSQPTLGQSFTSASAGAVPSGGSGGGYAGSATHSRRQPQLQSHRSAGPHPVRSSHAGSYGSSMPHAPPPPPALFKDDDMAQYLRPTHPRVSTSGPPSGQFEYYYPHHEDRNIVTPTADYRGYGMTVGYSTPTGSDWAAANMYPMGYPSYGHYYPYQHSTGLPQLGHLSASDPGPHHGTFGHGGHHGGFGGYQAPHPGYQREQSSRHSSRHSRRHDRHSHYDQRNAGEMRSASGGRRADREVAPATITQPQGQPARMKTNGRSASMNDPTAVQDMLDDIPGL